MASGLVGRLLAGGGWFLALGVKDESFFRVEDFGLG